MREATETGYSKHPLPKPVLGYGADHNFVHFYHVTNLQANKLDQNLPFRGAKNDALPWRDEEVITQNHSHGSDKNHTDTPADKPRPKSSQPEFLAFSGTADEYFRIWIVNILLTLLTLGIYSAWAKVRRKRYFYRHTSLRGDHFDYLASPVSILKGRLIVVPFLLAYLYGDTILIGISNIVLWIVILAFPWLLVRSRMFDLGNTSYRNIRFNFKKNYAGAYKTILGWGLLMILTFGLLYPYWVYRRHHFVANNSSFGRTAHVFFNASPWPFYGFYLGAGGIFLLGIISTFAIAYAIGSANPEILDKMASEDTNLRLPHIYLIAFLFFLTYLAYFVYLKVRVRNYIVGNSAFDQNPLHSTLSAREMFLIYLTNLFAIILSFGLLIPWASIRTARYRLENSGVTVVGDLDGFVAAEDSHVSATGEEMGDALDFEFGL